MNCRTLNALAVGAAVLMNSGLWAIEPAKEDQAARDAVKQAKALSDAFVKGDAETIKSLLADDQIAILGYGRPQTKADQLKKLADVKFESASMQDIKTIPIASDVIGVACKLVRKGTFEGKPLTPEVYVLAVWARRDGKWQQVTYQETLPDKK
jgi:hypothetical protein